MWKKSPYTNEDLPHPHQGTRKLFFGMLSFPDESELKLTRTDRFCWGVEARRLAAGQSDDCPPTRRGHWTIPKGRPGSVRSDGAGQPRAGVSGRAPRAPGGRSRREAGAAQIRRPPPRPSARASHRSHSAARSAGGRRGAGGGSRTPPSKKQQQGPKQGARAPPWRMLDGNLCGGAGESPSASSRRGKRAQRAPARTPGGPHRRLRPPLLWPPLTPGSHSKFAIRALPPLLPPSSSIDPSPALGSQRDGRARRDPRTPAGSPQPPGSSRDEGEGGAARPSRGREDAWRCLEADPGGRNPATWRSWENPTTPTRSRSPFCQGEQRWGAGPRAEPRKSTSHLRVEDQPSARAGVQGFGVTGRSLSSARRQSELRF